MNWLSFCSGFAIGVLATLGAIAAGIWYVVRFHSDDLKDRFVEYQVRFTCQVIDETFARVDSSAKETSSQPL